jgi:hypothetical protein
MNFLLGFIIALAVGLTGIGGGSFTVPALVLIGGLPGTAAVGTAFVFSGALRLIAAPFYILERSVHKGYLRLLLQGAIPGLLIGTIVLQLLSKKNSPFVVIILGIVLAASSAISFTQRMQNREFARKNSRWLPWFALPIGVEAGFSSAGAGALGTMLLINYSEMPPAQVVGTDILFGLVLAVIGTAFHIKFGAINTPILWQLLVGGVPGVLLGCAFARKVPAQKLRMIIALIALFAGFQLVWDGSRTLWTNYSERIVKTASKETTRIANGNRLLALREHRAQVAADAAHINPDLQESVRAKNQVPKMSGE